MSEAEKNSEPINIQGSKSKKNLPTIPKSPSTKYSPIVIENYKQFEKERESLPEVMIVEEKPDNEKEPIKTNLEKEIIPDPEKSLPIEPEAKKEPPRKSNEELMQQALNFENFLSFEAEEAVPKNILLLGKAGSGKTTLFKLLTKGPHKTTTPSFFAGQPRHPQAYSFTFRSQVDKTLKNYYINIIDTPGFGLVPSRLKDKRSDDEIIQSIQDGISSSVAFLSAIFILFPIGIIRENDVTIINHIKGILGDKLKKNTFLVFTHADEYRLETVNEMLTKFLESDIADYFLEYCQGGIRLSGVINGEMCDEYGTEYEEKARKKVIGFRDNLIKSVISQDNVQIEIQKNEKGARRQNNVPHSTSVERNGSVIKAQPKSTKK